MFGGNKTKSIEDKFCLMSWNVFKIDHKKHDTFNSYIKKIHSEHDVNIFCLQESKYSEETEFPINKFHTNFASNLTMKKHNYGVTTACNIPSLKNIKILTTHKESVINTHKASLVSQFKFANTQLTVVNIHAINFKTNKVYEYEFEKIKEYLQLEHKDNPIIIAGDFNTWNRARIKFIKDFCREFNFKIAYLEDNALVKTFQNNPLDFILYRGLKMEKAFVLDCGKISDHNPIIAYFNKL